MPNILSLSGNPIARKIYQPGCFGSNPSTKKLVDSLNIHFRSQYKLPLSAAQKEVFFDLLGAVLARKIFSSKKAISAETTFNKFKDECHRLPEVTDMENAFKTACLESLTRFERDFLKRSPDSRSAREPRHAVSSLYQKTTPVLGSLSPTDSNRTDSTRKEAVANIAATQAGSSPKKPGAMQEEPPFPYIDDNRGDADDLSATQVFPELNDTTVSGVTSDTSLSSHDPVKLSVRVRNERKSLCAPPPVELPAALSEEEEAFMDLTEARRPRKSLYGDSRPKTPIESPQDDFDCTDFGHASAAAAISEEDIQGVMRFFLVSRTFFEAKTEVLNTFIRWGWQDNTERYKSLFSQFSSSLNRFILGEVGGAEDPEIRLCYKLYLYTFCQALVNAAAHEAALDLLPSLDELRLLNYHAIRERQWTLDTKYKPVVPITGGVLHMDNQHRLGRGTYGVVKTGRYKTDSAVHKVAIKKVRLGGSLYEQYHRYIDTLTETALLEYLTPQHFSVPLLDAFLYGDGKLEKIPSGDRPSGNVSKVALVTSLADMDGWAYIKIQESFTQRLKLLHLSALALKALHGKGLAHNDFKLSNIFVFLNPDNGALDRVVLGDFGFCVPFAQDEVFPRSGYFVGGTYPAPEGLYIRKYFHNNARYINFSKVDIFSFGIELYMLIQRVLRIAEAPLYDGDLLYDAANMPPTEEEKVSKPNPAKAILTRMKDHLLSLKEKEGSILNALIDLTLKCIRTNPKDRIDILDVCDILGAILEGYIRTKSTTRMVVCASSAAQMAAETAVKDVKTASKVEKRTRRTRHPQSDVGASRVRSGTRTPLKQEYTAAAVPAFEDDMTYKVPGAISSDR